MLRDQLVLGTTLSSAREAIFRNQTEQKLEEVLQILRINEDNEETLDAIKPKESVHNTINMVDRRSNGDARKTSDPRWRHRRQPSNKQTMIKQLGPKSRTNQGVPGLRQHTQRQLKSGVPPLVFPLWEVQTLRSHVPKLQPDSRRQKGCSGRFPERGRCVCCGQWTPSGETMFCNPKTPQGRRNRGSNRQRSRLQCDTRDPEKLLDQYEDVSIGLGEFARLVTLDLDPNIPPRNQPQRRTPVNLRLPMIERIKDTERSNFIEKMTTPTSWWSNRVAVSKANGRICVTLDPVVPNRAIRRSRYPIPILEAKLNHWIYQMRTEKGSQLIRNGGFLRNIKPQKKFLGPSPPCYAPTSAQDTSSEGAYRA